MRPLMLFGTIDVSRRLLELRPRSLLLWLAGSLDAVGVVRQLDDVLAQLNNGLNYFNRVFGPIIL